MNVANVEIVIECIVEMSYNSSQDLFHNVNDVRFISGQIFFLIFPLLCIMEVFLHCHGHFINF